MSRHISGCHSARQGKRGKCSFEPAAFVLARCLSYYMEHNDYVIWYYVILKLFSWKDFLKVFWSVWCHGKLCVLEQISIDAVVPDRNEEHQLLHFDILYAQSSEAENLRLGLGEQTRTLCYCIERGNNPLTLGCAPLTALFISFQKQLGSIN